MAEDPDSRYRRILGLLAHWAHHEQLQEAWRLSLAWGQAHPNVTKSVRAERRALSDDE